MSFKEGQQVELNTFGKPVDGKHALIKGTITALTHGHAILCFKSISPGVRLAVKPSGQIVMLGETGKAEPDWKLLSLGDIEAVPLADLCAVVESQPIPEWVTPEEAEHWLGEYAYCLNGSIERGTVKQSIDGKLLTSDVLYLCKVVPTLVANNKREQLMSAQEQAKAQEARHYVEKVGQLSR